MTMHDALCVYDRPRLRNISPHRVAVLSREQRQVFRIYSTIRISNWSKGVYVGLIRSNWYN